MPGTPPVSPRFGAPRYANTDEANFAPQVNAVTDVFDAAVAWIGDVRFPAGADIVPTDIDMPALQAALQAAFQSALASPGDICMSGASGKAGWLYCNGASYSTGGAQASLFAAIGYTYGGSGANFNVPDLRGKFPLGTSGSHAMGQTGGAETVALAATEMPSHVHSGPAHVHTSAAHVHTRGAHTHDPASSGHYLTDAGGAHWAYGATTPSGADIGIINPPSTGSGGTDTGSTTPNDTGSSGTANTGSAGSGAAHQNMPPFLAVQFFIKL